MTMILVYVQCSCYFENIVFVKAYSIKFRLYEKYLIYWKHAAVFQWCALLSKELIENICFRLDIGYKHIVYQ